MSGGKRFLDPEAEKDVVDRLSILERQIPAFLERISSYDNNLDSFNKMSSSLDQFKSNCDYFKNSLQLLEASFNEYKKLFEEREDVLNRLISEQKLNIALCCKDNEDTKKYLNSRIDETKVSIKNLSDESINKISHKADRSELDVQGVYLKSILSDLTTAINATKSKQEQMSSLFLSHAEECKFKYIPSQQYQTDSLEKDKKLSKIESSVSSLENSLSAQISQNSLRLDENLERFKIELSSRHLPEISLRDELLKKIDFVALDSSNACLRSQNSDQQLKILEKKIENIFLILKKYELNTK